MRGIISFVLVLVFASIMANVAETRLDAAREAHAAKAVVFALEKRYYADLDVKNAFRQVLASAAGTTSEEKILDAARKIVLLEQFAEKNYADKGIQIDLWLGDAGKTTVTELGKKMLAEKTVLKPNGALDLSTHVVDWRGEPAPLSASLLSLDQASGKLFVSRNLAVVPEQPFANPVFGISIYFQDAAAVALIEEGFHA